MPNNQNGRKPLEAAKKMLKEKGYYIVLFLCIVAVGISGYIFIRSAVSVSDTNEADSLSTPSASTDDASLDVPLTAPTPESDTPSDAAQDAATPTDTADKEDAVTTMTDAEVSQIASQIVVRPLSGSTQKAYSMDALVYSETMADWRVHDGIDIAAVSGEQVLAAKAGTVSAVYNDDFYGSTVEITHDNGWRTVYSNLTGTALVTAGQTVAAGTVIGAVGNTAISECADAPHLHFEVWYGDQLADPEAFLP